MPSQPPIPHLLTPYIAHSARSPQSLTLITSVLAATSNWLVLRYLYSILSADTDTITGGTSTENNGDRHSRAAKKIVLVSFLRDWAFWKAEGKRLGLDLQRFVDADRLRFVDGLTGLFQPASATTRTAGGGLAGSGRPTPAPVSSLPMRGGPGAARAPPSPANIIPTPTPTTATTKGPKQLHISTSNNASGTSILNSLENDILSVVKTLPQTTNDSENNNDSEGDTLLILDQPDFVLASTPEIDADDISEWIMGLQQYVHSTIVTTSADFPLVQNATTAGDDSSSGAASATPLERHHAAFVVGLAHRAAMVLQLRMLDTGAAKDVSGVVRMSKGGGGNDDAVVEKEFLYFVQRDGGVRVFGRGEV